MSKTKMENDADAVFLEGTIPLLKSAINISGDGGGQFKIEVPESSMDGLKKLMDFRGEELHILVKRVRS